MISVVDGPFVTLPVLRGRARLRVMLPTDVEDLVWLAEVAHHASAKTPYALRELKALGEIRDAVTVLLNNLLPEGTLSEVVDGLANTQREQLANALNEAELYAGRQAFDSQLLNRALIQIAMALEASAGLASDKPA